MNEAPKGARTHIAIIGRRNAGKSSLLNALAGQKVSIVSPVAGTTTDPVEKTLEMLPLGPVVLMDTAGLDDQGVLGGMRNERSRQILARTDLAVLVANGNDWGEIEDEIVKELREKEVPFVIARNKSDVISLRNPRDWLKINGLDPDIPIMDVSASCGVGMQELRDCLASLAPDDISVPLLADLLPSGGTALLVVPIDMGAPKGRLILPQVQAIRDALDADMVCIVLKDTQLSNTLQKFQPGLVVCDSQIVRKVAEIVPESVPLTTFSILMARQKGNLASLARGAGALKELLPGDHVVIQEACSHHPQKDDIGRVKIPRLLRKMAGGDLQLTFMAGKEQGAYPADTKAIVHCGGCVITPANMRRRQKLAERADIPMTNYGMAISCAQGILGRVLKPFPEAVAAWQARG